MFYFGRHLNYHVMQLRPFKVGCRTPETHFAKKVLFNLKCKLYGIMKLLDFIFAANLYRNI